MSDQANKTNYYGLLDGDYDEYTAEMIHGQRSDVSQTRCIGAAEPEAEVSENETEHPPAQDSRAVDDERLSAITSVILLSKDPSTLHKRDRTFATKQSGIYRNQVFAAMTAQDRSVFSELETEVKGKVTAHINRSEQGKSQIKTLFQAITKPDTRPSLTGCPSGSVNFVRGMRNTYRKRLKDKRTDALWKEIGDDCSKFVKRPDRVVVPSMEE